MAIDPHRSWTMSRVKSKDTAPERIVRAALSKQKLRYRLHVKALPGAPDIVFKGRKRTIFVHGCFWHGHNCKRGARIPKTNADYWIGKVSKNRARDANHIAALRAEGWKVLVIWECQTRDDHALSARIRRFFGQ